MASRSAAAIGAVEVVELDEGHVAFGVTRDHDAGKRLDGRGLLGRHAMVGDRRAVAAGDGIGRRSRLRRGGMGKPRKQRDQQQATNHLDLRHAGPAAPPRLHAGSPHNQKSKCRDGANADAAGQ
jgi:hypothetical protein